jgi:two-component system response regulator AtoC
LLVRNAKGEAERGAIASALEQTHWNRKAAARLLNVSYRALLYKIQEYGLMPPADAARLFDIRQAK